MSTSFPPPPAGPLPPPRRRTPVWIWIVLGIFGFLFLCVAAVGIGGYYFVRQVARDPKAFVSAIVRNDPNIEVVSKDDGAGFVTLRDKRSGKTVTINYDDAKNGRISFDADGKHVTLRGGADGVEVHTPDGNAAVGAGSAKAPAWVPAYPGSSPVASAVKEEDGERHGSFAFTSRDPLDKVGRYYEDVLTRSGYTLDERATGGAPAYVSGRTASGDRSLRVVLKDEGGETHVKLEFRERTKQ